MKKQTDNMGADGNGRKSSKPTSTSSSILKKARRTSSERFYPCSPPPDVLEFLEQPFPEPTQFWGEGLLFAKSKVIICGESKIKKTFFVLNLSVSLATGKSFVGLNISRRTKVLYLQKEISEAMLQRRLKTILSATDPQPERGYFIVETLPNLDVGNSNQFPQVCELIQRYQPEVVIFDPLYQFHHADENSEQDMKAVLDQFDALVEKYNVSVVLVHHTRKYQNHDWRGNHLMRGSVVLRDWLDTLLLMTKRTNEETIRLDWTVRHTEEAPSQYIQMNKQCWFEVVRTPRSEPRGDRWLVLKKLMLQINPKGTRLVEAVIIKKAKQAKLGGSGTIRRTLKAGKGGFFQTDKVGGSRQWWVV